MCDTVLRRMEGVLTKSLEALPSAGKSTEPSRSGRAGSEPPQITIRWTPPQPPRRTRGVVSASAAVHEALTLDVILNMMVDFAEECYVGGSFAVRARRAGDSVAYPFMREAIQEIEEPPSGRRSRDSNSRSIWTTRRLSSSSNADRTESSSSVRSRTGPMASCSA